jgi:hypothetical protein
MALVLLVTAPDQMTAELWVSILREAGIAAMIRASDAVSFLGVSAMGCRVLVEESDRQRALDILGDDVIRGIEEEDEEREDSGGSP